LLALPAEWQVVALHRPGTAALPAFLHTHGLEHVTAVACELTDTHSVHEATFQVGNEFDCCIYLAANTSIPDSIAHPLNDLASNTVGLLHVLEHCRFEHIIFFSSGAVYEGLRGDVGPHAPVAPTLPYAISKLAAERYVAAYVERRQTVARATIVRFFGAYGPYEPARKLYTRVVRRFAIDRAPDYTVTGDGENYIDAMYVDDAVRALLAMMERPPTGVYITDLGLGNRETVNAVVRRAAHTFGVEPVITHTGESPEYITFAIDPLPFRTRYGVVPQVPLEEGLQRLAAHLHTEVNA
jgi:UDP-glucose 4-epimerase